MLNEKQDRGDYKPVFVDNDKDRAKSYRDYLIKHQDEDRENL